MTEDQQIHIIGNEDTVLLFGLLGIEGTVIKKDDNFLEIFKTLLNKREIGILIISMNLPAEILEYLIDLKLNSKKPLIHFLPNVFQEGIENDYIFRNKIFDSIGEIISQKEDLVIRKKGQ